MTTDLARWFERKQIDELLQLRLKEITCLYEIRRSMDLELAIEDVCQIIFKYLIPAMRYPENAIAIIELDGKHFTSNNIFQANNRLTVDANDSDPSIINRISVAQNHSVLR